MANVMTRARALVAGIRGSGFGAWARSRPFVGGVLAVLAGVEMFFSGQLDIGNIHVQLGIEGFQATIIPIGMVLLGTLAVLMPAHRIFYGVLTLVLAVYSLIGVNLGGFFVGMLLGSVGGVLIVAWMPKPAAADEPTDPPAKARKHALPLVPSRS
jgi:hypothetical protein